METTIAIYSNSEMGVNNKIKSFKIRRPGEKSESTFLPSVFGFNRRRIFWPPLQK